MTHLPAKARLLLVVVVLSNVLGNLLLTVGVKALGAAGKVLAPKFLAEVAGPVLLGVTLLVVWMLSRMTLMSWADLSYILPVTSIGYVLSALAGRLFLDEHVSLTRWAGTLLIVAGTALVSRTAARTRT